MREKGLHYHFLPKGFNSFVSYPPTPTSQSIPTKYREAVMIHLISWIGLFNNYKPRAHYVPGTFQMIGYTGEKTRWWFLPTWSFHFQWWETQTEWTDSEVYRVKRNMTFGQEFHFPNFFSSLLFYFSRRDCQKAKAFKHVHNFPILFMYMFTAHTCTPGSRDNFQLWFKNSDLLHNGIFKSSQNREEFVKM